MRTCVRMNIGKIFRRTQIYSRRWFSRNIVLTLVCTYRYILPTIGSGASGEVGKLQLLRARLCADECR